MTTTSARNPPGNGAVVIPEGEGVGHRMPTNKSSQKLVNEDFLQTSSTRNSLETGSSSGGGGDSIGSSDDNTPEIPRRPKVTKMEWITVFILFYVNLINYMDRFTIAGEINAKTYNHLSTCCLPDTCLFTFLKCDVLNVLCRCIRPCSGSF